jgi:phosphopentomutase/2,3-bisphosphoglycerate-independent phosphoglycerate mutase family metalloenzyme
MAVLAAALTSTTLAQPRSVPAGELEADPGVSLAPPDRAAVVIVLDGARWQDVLIGVDGELAAEAKMDPRSANEPTMPRLAELARTRGALYGAPDSGTVIRASGPNFVSLPGYSEILGGRPPAACGSNQCPPTLRPTLADEMRAWSDSPRDVAIFSSWPDLVRVATLHPHTLVVSGGRSLRQNEPLLREDDQTSDLLDRGASALAWPGDGDFRPDRFTVPLAARYLEVARPRFLFLSLGEPDEYAHRGDYAEYLESLRFADDAIAGLVDAIDRMGERGRRTTVYVTADHGRARDFRDHGAKWPESSRSWLVVIGDTQARGVVDGTAERRLADIAPTVRAWMGMPADPSEDSGRAIGELLPAAQR